MNPCAAASVPKGVKSLASLPGDADPRCPRLLDAASSLAALAGLFRYAILLGSGEYFKWGTPLLVASVACTLLSIAPGNRAPRSARGHYRSLNAEGRSSLARMIVPACYQKTRGRLQRSLAARRLRAVCRCLSRKIGDDNHRNLVFLSAAVIVVPCLAFFSGKVAGHVSHAGTGIDHTKLANDFGKLGSAALSFLLVPVSKHSPILGALGLGEVHTIRLHICAGCVALFGGISHGLYYTYLWLKLMGYKYDDIFPSGECWGLLGRNYGKDCHEKFVNVTGIVCGISFLVMGLSSLYWVRRKWYRLFYSLHVIVSTLVLFGLVMHYNKMIWYISPSLLYYGACNLPVHVESSYKWWMCGGTRVARVTCIPDSDGCVELSFRAREESAAAVLDDWADDGGGGGHRADYQSFRNTVGRYAKLYVPEVSPHSHPFTIFSHPDHSSRTVQMLFRPCGSFTTVLSKRLKALTLMPEPTPSEIENHHRTFLDNRNGPRSHSGSCPKMLVNGMRCGMPDMLERAASHGRVLIFAGGVGIVSYISLIHALRSAAAASLNTRDEDEDGKIIINNHRRAIYAEDADDLGGGFDHIENGEEAVLERALSKDDAKHVYLHWMTRDEGLARHVLQNYLEPIVYWERGSWSPGGCRPLSISVVVHHTSPHATPRAATEGESSTSLGNGDNFIERTTWEPGLRRSSLEAGEVADLDHCHGLFASPASSYQGNGPSLSCNVLPAATHAAILFGGLWMVKYCYENLQDKHVVETRLAAVVGVILLSLAISVASNAVVLASGLFYSKLFAYSKLETTSSGAAAAVTEEDGDGEIECGRVGSGAGRRRPPGNENDSALGPESNPRSASSKAMDQARNDSSMSIKHEWGRPDLEAIVQDALKGRTEELGDIEDESNVFEGAGSRDDQGDVGIFMCGPPAMLDSLWNAIKKEKRSALCKGAITGTNVAVYQEVFEL